LRKHGRSNPLAQAHALINAVIDETAGTESGRITSLNRQAENKK